MALAPTKLQLFGSALSWSNACVRIAARLKGISLIDHNMSIASNNPNAVPDTAQREYPAKHPNITRRCLVAQYQSGESLTLNHPLSMLEFLEESYQGKLRLLPPVTDMAARTQVRGLAALAACETQLVQNSQARAKQRSLIQNPMNWAKETLWKGILVYDYLVKHSVGTYSVGDEVSIADVCLYPMMQGARRINVYDATYLARKAPTVNSIMQALQEIEAFRDGGLQTEDVPMTQSMSISREVGGVRASR